MKKLSFALMGVVAVVIAVSTILPNSETIYGSLWFKLLWGAIVVCGTAVILKARLWQRPAVFLLHLSFIVILLGALITSLTSHRGTLHLRQGIPTDGYVCQNQLFHLPEYIRLDSFYIVRYPGTQAPQDYVSLISSEGKNYRISMNKIARIHGYRLYQTSYDEDLQGSILTVNYDPYGTPVTYAGYTLFLISFLLTLIKPKRKYCALIALLVVSAATANNSLPVIPRHQADSLEQQTVIWNNRTVPFGVVAHDFMQKVYGKPNFQGLTPTQTVVSWTLAPKAWNAQPLIKEKGKGYRCLNDFIGYSQATPVLRGMGQNAATDEKVALILMLQNGTLTQTPTADAPKLSTTRIQAELLNVRMPWSIIGVAICALSLLASFIRRIPKRPILASSLAFLIFHSGLRWYLSGHIPLSNTYETLHFVALCLVAYATIKIKESWTALLAAIAALFVAWLVDRNPQITPLMPILHSPWLSAHVSIIMLSYALLVLSFFRRQLLRVAVGLLAIGIFLGAVWANVSWGAYWTWDPKESWALITLIAYSIPLHTESLPWFRSTRNYRLYSLLCLAALLMTYFGVNYLLGGMHSYA